MKYKYVILDFGKVLAGPATGDWFITPKFEEVIDMSLIDRDVLNEEFNKYNDIIGRKMMTQEEEYNSFFELYSLVLQEINYPKYNDDVVHEIAYNFTYESDKYTFYDYIKEELDGLRKKYKLILLTDNWPCVEKILDDKKLTKYFEKVYISSYYGTQKKDGIFFDYVVDDFNIKPHEALFIDDNEVNLERAEEKGIDVLLMDRDNEVTNSKYKKICSLFDI